MWSTLVASFASKCRFIRVVGQLAEVKIHNFLFQSTIHDKHIQARPVQMFHSWIIEALYEYCYASKNNVAKRKRLVLEEDSDSC
jgi:hypothetical protein